MTEETRKELQKFTQDPSWHLMQELMEGHLEPLRDIMSIDKDLSNDQIASEVRGRQITIKALDSFLRNAGIINGPRAGTKTTFQ